MAVFTDSAIAELKQRACARIEEMRGTLIDVSTRIWRTPELGFGEHQASQWLCDLLAAGGYDVRRGVGSLETAFTARAAGTGAGPTVGVFSEYDALPELGHGCGHNLLAISGVGAGLGLAAVLRDLPGVVQVHGTPAEEGGSGKTLLLREGAFEDLDFALIFHPSAAANVLERMRTGQGLVFTFTGKHAHAASHPDLAIDALNGVIALFNNVNLLRQHFLPDVSVTGSIMEGGGRRAFPVKAVARFVVRVFEGETDFQALRQMVVDCARAAALATRTGLAVAYGNLERGMKLNDTVTRLTSDNARTLGIDLSRRVTMGGMSDFGNVSHKVPATHFSTVTWPAGVTAHTPEAVTASCRPEAFDGALQAAKIEAMTAIDLLARPNEAQRAQRDFREQDLGDIPVNPDAA